MAGTEALPAPAAGPPAALGVRCVEAASAYLPLLLMAVLALGTWWLVQNAPRPPGSGEARAPRHVPDYTMSVFTVQRFAPDGRLRVQIEGDTLRHYPDTDTLEVDNPRIRSIAADGVVTRATARRAISNGDGTEVQLLGGAQVLRDGLPGEPPAEFRGEFLHAFLATEELRSHLPVVLRRGSTELRANSLNYRHRDQRVTLSGRVRAVFGPSGVASAPAAAASGTAP
ncbi:LPS export ABC transporter periplasmic protein LptC [Piscinibacter sakaiensis]|uniref:Putative transmembrane protein n=1 Tax=Piscinibacter sakaiensis TaxID=1547922 RepID=A0A0K8P5G3_PISS1|nr:LPS export ABC transporter periplasmic protein LptC [Piscinibacter sakaiensis]GAP37852.1 putative transmembrane protein [Piscinibacter sakaiensis]